VDATKRGFILAGPDVRAWSIKRVASTVVSGITVSAIGLNAAVGHVAEPPAFGVPSCRSAAIRGSECAIVRCS
jgi:hypothetical protein